MTLLDFKTWDKEELLQKMYDDTFYYGYLGKAALSSSSVKLLNDSPKKYKYVTEYGNIETQPLRNGRLFHIAILETQKFEQLNFVDVQSKNSKKYKDAKIELGEVYTIKEKNEAERMADALLKNHYAIDLLSGSEFEVPAIDMIFGYPFRAKADVIGSVLVDLKTTQDLKAFPTYKAKAYGYDSQCFIYCELFKKDYKDFRFLVIDKGTLDIGIFDVSEEFYFSGERKVQYAVETYNEFFEQGESLEDYVIRGTL